MTAINVVCQKRHKLVHVLTDAASYTPDGVLAGIGTKVFVEPNWPGVVTGRGTAIAVPLLGAALSLRFLSFDALVDGIEDVLEEMVDYYNIQGSAELVIAGISGNRGPEAYMIVTDDAPPKGCSLEAARASGHWPAPFRLQRLHDMTCGPVPTVAAINAAVEFAGFEVFGTDDAPADVVAGLTTFIEMQRNSLFDDGICWVGGHAELTTISAEGTSHRILKRWPDKVGELMKPKPDWQIQDFRARGQADGEERARVMGNYVLSHARDGELKLMVFYKENVTAWFEAKEASMRAAGASDPEVIEYLKSANAAMNAQMDDGSRIVDASLGNRHQRRAARAVSKASIPRKFVPKQVGPVA